MRVVARTDLTIRDLTEVPQPINPEDPRLTMAEKELQESGRGAGATSRVSRVPHPQLATLRRRVARPRDLPRPGLIAVPGTPDPVRRTQIHQGQSHPGPSNVAEKALAATGLHVYVWRPYDWITGGVERILRGPRERV